MAKYQIVRFYASGDRSIIGRNLSLARAQEHRSDKETSSSTATSEQARLRTKHRGQWFDGYEQQ